ncbi:hypothetical protein Aduo_010185 [Ancylostoma duodenale]
MSKVSTAEMTQMTQQAVVQIHLSSAASASFIPVRLAQNHEGYPGKWGKNRQRRSYRLRHRRGGGLFCRFDGGDGYEGTIWIRRRQFVVLPAAEDRRLL